MKSPWLIGLVTALSTVAGAASAESRLAFVVGNDTYRNVDARRGRFFRDPALAAHFGRFAWYRPYAWDVPLNAVEQANVRLIASLER